MNVTEGLFCDDEISAAQQLPPTRFSVLEFGYFVREEVHRTFRLGMAKTVVHVHMC